MNAPAPDPVDPVTHGLVPALLWLAAMLLVQATGADTALGDLFHDSVTGRWMFSGDGWAHLLLYRGGRALVIGTVLLSLLLVVASFLKSALARWRRPAAYLLFCILLTTGLAGLGKHTSNMDCPRDLERYGGDRPHIELLQDRPDSLPGARCFPGGHSSGGFSFLALYFLLGERRPAWRWAGLAAGLALGFSFALVQWGRGMHFVSHDLTSAAIGWLVALSAYTVAFRNSVWHPPGRGRDAPAAD